MAGQTKILHGAASREMAKRLIDAAPARAVVTIRPERRSEDQNAKMWAMLSDVSRAKPEGRRHTPEVWKQLFMHACGWASQFEMGLNGEPFPTGFRSSRLSKAQMSELIECIYERGAVWGVVWSDEAEDA